MTRLIRVEGNDQGRLAGLFLDSPGNDPDHAGMPAASSQGQYCTVMLRIDLRFGLFLDHGLDRAAFLVQGRKLRGNGAGLFRVLGRQQAHAQSRFANASPGVDARPQGKAQVAAGRRAGQAAGVDQRGHAHAVTPGHDFKPL